MVRLVAATPLFAVALVFLVRSWNPLGEGYFSGYPDSPTGVYFTTSGIGLSLAILSASAGFVIASRRYRARGGLLVVAIAAVVASVLPYMLFKWTSRPDTWPWVVLLEDYGGWLRFEQRSRSFALKVQAVLALIAIGSAGMHVALRRQNGLQRG